MSLHKKLSSIKHKSSIGNGSSENASATKVDSAIAKYDSAGNLTCIVCKSVVKSSNLWKVHINSKQHKLRLENATRNQLAVRPPSETAPKPILKTGTKQTVDTTKNPTLETTIKRTSLKNEHKEAASVKSKNVVDKPIRITTDKSQLGANTDADVKTALPEQFFDDPVSDAKQRNVVVKDQKNEEWARFQREIKEVSLMSNAIIAEEQDDDALKQQLLEIDGQIEKFSKVIMLSQKSKTGWKRDHSTKKVNSSVEDEPLSDEDLDWTELGDWRAKRIKK